MTLARPEFMWLMLLIPAAAVLMWLSDQAKRTRVSRHGGPLLARTVNSSVDHWIKLLKRVMLLTSLALLVLAIAGPSYGTELIPEIDIGVDIMLVVDVSKSMLATDILPSRLESVRLSIQDLVRNLRGERIGLVAFSGTAFVQCPLTSDYSAFLMYARDLSVASIPRGGTNIEQALMTAVGALDRDENRSRVIILLSDGENHEGDPIAGAEYALSKGMAVYVVGIGSLEGEIIPVVDDLGRQTYLRTEDGQVVKSSLDENLLADIARAGGGRYSRASQTDLGLLRVYDEYIDTLSTDLGYGVTAQAGPHAEGGQRMRSVPVDRYYIPLLIAVVLLACEMVISERRRQRCPQVRRTAM
ncbi:MAG: VWA domain-containing protein [Firmicutes bacterium]|nr:VWA domain-containing protein [Bacillota bacterium]